MSRVSRTTRKKEGTCAYCGAVGSVSMDHVLPSTLFIQKDASMITVPACSACHDDKTKTDADLRDFVVFDIGSSGHPDIEQHIGRVARATMRNQSTLGKAYLEHAVDHDLVTDNGTVIATVPVIPTETFAEPVLRSMRYIVRGLYMVEAKTSLPADCPVEVAHVAPERRLAAVEHLGQLPSRSIVEKGRSVARYAYWIPDDAPLTSAWLVSFYDGVLFLGQTGAAALGWRDYLRTSQEPVIDG